MSLDFWHKQLKESVQSYSPMEGQRLELHWALIETQVFTWVEPVTLWIDIPVVPLVIAEAPPVPSEVCIQMVPYLLDWSKPGPTRVLQLHEELATFPATEVNHFNLHTFILLMFN